MTSTGLILLTMVGLLNLSLGFSAATILGRGPWSARARASMSETKVANPSDAVGGPVQAPGSSEETLVETAIGTTAASTIGQVIEGMERIEHIIQTLREQIQQSGEPLADTLLEQWSTALAAGASQLDEIRTDFEHIARQDALPEEIVSPAMDSLDSLQRQWKDVAFTLADPAKVRLDRAASIDQVLTACQMTRGALNATSFFQSSHGD